MSFRSRVLLALLLLTGCSAHRCEVQEAEPERPPSWSIPKGPTPMRALALVSADAGEVSALKQGTEELTWTFEQPELGRIDVVVVLPDRREGERFPLLIALHGRGEAMKGPVLGARGWVDDYALGRALRRLAMPPLRREDFEDIVDPSRLRFLNNSLRVEPYQGMVVLCPYTPDVLAGERSFERVRPYARFLAETLIPRARRELPVIDSAAATGIDGVSLGGRVSLLSGLNYPRAFGAIATLQAAFNSDDAPKLAAMAVSAKEANPDLKFRFVTSDGDYFLAANRAIDQAFKTAHVAHAFLLVPGPHDYIFNRGAGVIEMLLWHDRALRNRPAP